MTSNSDSRADAAKLSWLELDALNVCLHWFGGKLTALDAWVASIPTRRFHDLEDVGCVRRTWTGWEITKRGISELKRNGITKFSDTRDG